MSKLMKFMVAVVGLAIILPLLILSGTGVELIGDLFTGRKKLEDI